MIEPSPRKAVQNLKTFQAIAGPDLCITREIKRNNSPENSRSRNGAGSGDEFRPSFRWEWSERYRKSAGFFQFWGKNKKGKREKKTKTKTKFGIEIKVSWKSEDFRVVFSVFAFGKTAKFKSGGKGIEFSVSFSRNLDAGEDGNGVWIPRPKRKSGEEK